MAGCSSTLARFDADWSLLADRLLDPPLVGTAQEALDRARREGDPWLGRLLAAAQSGDEIAGRCVVQAVLGRLAGMVVRDSRLDLDHLVAAVWIRLRAYPLDRRPRAIASNLVLDARKDVLRELRPLPVSARPEPTHHAQAVEVLQQAVQIGIIDSGIGEVMRSVYVLGLSGEAAAQRHGVTPTTVRWRCSAGMRRLARARALLV